MESLPHIWDDSAKRSVQEFIDEYKDDTNPKMFWLLTISLNLNIKLESEKRLAEDAEELGLAYNGPYNCFYWHNHLDANDVLDKRDERILDAYFDSLEKKTGKKKIKRPEWNWFAGASELRDKYTEVALQHAASERDNKGELK